MLILGQFLALVALYAKGSAISYDERHFRFVGISFLLAALVAAERSGEQVKKLAVLVVALFATYGIASFTASVLRATTTDHFDPVSGLQQPLVSKEVLAEVRAIGGAHASVLVVVPSPEIALALPGMRTMAIHLDFTGIDELKKSRFSGRVEKLIVFAEERMDANGKIEAVLGSFGDYDRAEWKRRVVDGFVIYEV